MLDIEGLPPEFKVIGINDYLFLEGYERVLTEHADGRMQNIALFLPLIELRLNRFGGSGSALSRVNYHVLFSNELDPPLIRDQFISALSSRFELLPRHAGTSAESAWSGTLSPKALADLGSHLIENAPEEERHKYGSPRVEGFNNLTLPLEGVREALDNSFLRGRFVTGIGKAEWADVKWQDGSIADKKDLINGADCVFVAAESRNAFEKARASLIAGGVNDRLLDCSDAHHPAAAEHKDRIGNCLLWVKADLTFGGLLQALHEYDKRVFVGDEPPELRRVRQHPSKYIDRVRVTRREDASNDDRWFDVDMPLNPGLVAVIGNKGSGKSALAEVIGLAGRAPHEDDFSFLTASKFRDPRERIAQDYDGEIIWADGESDRVRLSDTVPGGSEPRVQHLPQRYLETLCTEIPSGEKTLFDEELERIIFAHLPTEKTLGAKDLRTLISLIVGSTRTKVEEARGDLFQLNVEIAAQEELLKPEIRQRRREAYRTKRREWWELKCAPPEEVPEPDESDAALATIRQEIRQLDIAADELTALRSETEQRLSAVRRDVANLAALRAGLEAVRARHAALLASHEELIERVGLKDGFTSISLDEGEFNRIEDDLSEREALLESVLRPDEVAPLDNAIDWTQGEIERLRGELSAPAERREAFLAEKKRWSDEVEALLGDPETPNSLLGARAALRSLDQIPSELAELRGRRIDLTRQIHALLKQQAEEISTLYGPLQDYMDEQDVPSDYLLSIGTSLVDEGFADAFLGHHIRRDISGSFCGVAESLRRLSTLIGETSFDDTQSVLDFVQSVDEHLRFDKRFNPSPKMQPAEQVRIGSDLAKVYDFIFGLSYLSPRYGLQFGGKPIYRLSPGEKGTLLLIFFLLVELDTRPLIIDQPEDNLDNNTVFRALVRCFQAAKARRQVLIVTHNPNLAVVCDADQIIEARMGSSDQATTIHYEAGAIERPHTVQAVVDILEGTHPAFTNRSVKYSMHLLGLN